MVLQLKKKITCLYPCRGKGFAQGSEFWNCQFTLRNCFGISSSEIFGIAVPIRKVNQNSRGQSNDVITFDSHLKIARGRQAFMLIKKEDRKKIDHYVVTKERVTPICQEPTCCKQWYSSWKKKRKKNYLSLSLPWERFCVNPFRANGFPIDE